jgi:hypothetical protein
VGGSEAVSLTQKYQIGVIFAGMLTALGVLLTKLPPELTLTDALTVAGGFHKLKAVDFSVNVRERYTFWSGLLGGLFLALAYFGTDQSQVQRYISGSSLRESRLGLMFNAVCKIPMQFLILLLGVLVFVFYQFEQPPIFFNQTAWKYQARHGHGEQLQALEGDFAQAFSQKRQQLHQWLEARHSGDPAAEATAKGAALAAHERARWFGQARKAMAGANRTMDYVFILYTPAPAPRGHRAAHYVFLPPRLVQGRQLNALGSTTIVDFTAILSNAERTTRTMCLPRNASRSSGGWWR